MLTRSVLVPICPVTASNKVGTLPRFLKRFLIGEVVVFGVGGLGTNGLGLGGLGVGPINGALAGK